jgi:hypothetical protein
MGAALTIFVLLSFSVFVIRVASVALRLTGLTDASARFQALSAFTGTGFTTNESETIVNYPVRRRVIALLMIIGNMGLITVFATVVISMVNTDGETAEVIQQVIWLLGGLSLLWFLMLNKTADRILCSLIGKFLTSTTFLGQRSYQRLLQVGDGYSICEHPVTHLLHEDGHLNMSKITALDLSVLAVHTCTGELFVNQTPAETLNSTDTLTLFGRDIGHEELGKIRDSAPKN